MSEQDIIRAWKEGAYRNRLSSQQQSQLPENPAGMIELSDEEAKTIVAGGRMTKGFICKGAGGISKGVFCRGPAGVSQGFFCRGTRGITKGVVACR